MSADFCDNLTVKFKFYSWNWKRLFLSSYDYSNSQIKMVLHIKDRRFQKQSVTFFIVRESSDDQTRDILVVVLIGINHFWVNCLSICWSLSCGGSSIIG